MELLEFAREFLALTRRLGMGADSSVTLLLTVALTVEVRRMRVLVSELSRRVLWLEQRAGLPLPTTSKPRR